MLHIQTSLHLPYDITLAVIQGKKIETPFYMRQPLKSYVWPQGQK